MLIAAERPNAQTPIPAKPQFPEASIGGAVRGHPILNNIGAKLTAAQGAAKFGTKLKYEAAAVEQPCTPYPALEPMEEPLNPRSADDRMTVGSDVATQKSSGSRHINRQRRISAWRSCER